LNKVINDIQQAFAQIYFNIRQGKDLLLRKYKYSKVKLNIKIKEEKN
jgi:hypothetical protein